MRRDLGQICAYKHENISLRSGRTVTVRKCPLPLSSWMGDPIPSYGGKSIIDVRGQPLYAELVLLHYLQEAGWQGFWVDSYGKCYRTDLPHEAAGIVDISSTPPARRFPNAFKKFRGAWDIVAWKGEDIIFLESKRKSKDSIRDTQISWLEDRLNDGAVEDQFILVEWTVPNGKKDQLLELREGQWYAYQMLPGYGSGPYFSPIRIDVVKRAGRNIKVEFLNAAYPEGVRDFKKEYLVLSSGPDYLVAKELNSSECRTVAIARLTLAWSEHTIPEWYRRKHPLLAEEEADQDFQRYLNRLWLSGNI